MKINKQYLIDNNVINKTGRITPSIGRLLIYNPALAQKIIESTSFILYDAPLKTRIHFILQQISIQPKCWHCQAILKMAKSGPRANTIGKYCGAKCAVKDPNIRAKQYATNIKKYGYLTPLSSSYIRRNINQIILLKYGVENVMLNDDIKQKRKIRRIK